MSALTNDLNQSVFIHSTIDTFKNETSKNDRKEQLMRIGKVTLKVLALIGMVSGVALSLGGGAAFLVGVGSTAAFGAVASSVMKVSVIAGTGLLKWGRLFLPEPLRTLTVPLGLAAAAVCFVTPIFSLLALTFSIGMIPGIGLVSLSAWQWETLSKKILIK